VRSVVSVSFAHLIRFDVIALLRTAASKKRWRCALVLSQDVNRAMVTQPCLGKRQAVAVAVALSCVAILAFDRVAEPDAVPDFDHLWFAAKGLLQGRDPYLLIGPGREYNWPWLYYYPLTAPTSILPLAFLPLNVARAVFVAVPAGFLAFLLTRDGFGRLPFFASGAWVMAVKTAQWGPLVLCGLLVPWLGAFCSAKPNLGIGTLAGARSLGALFRMLAGSAGLVLLSLFVSPGWPSRWLDIIAQAPQPLSILTLWGGPLLLLTIVRWRRWEARMLLLFALVPQTSGAVGTLALLLVPRSLRALTILAILSYVPVFYAPQMDQTIEQWARREALATLYAVYLPVLFLVLRMPNKGPLPARLERIAQRLPRWLRGEPGPATDPVSMDDSPLTKSDERPN
jgi:hypothetical protein